MICQVIANTLHFYQCRIKTMALCLHSTQPSINDIKMGGIRLARVSHLPLSALLLMVLQTAALATLSSSAVECPNKPAGRLEGGLLECPVPGRIGIVDDEQNAMSWTVPPRCINQALSNGEASRIDCLFTSSEFRNGHGTSLVTATTTAAHLVGLEVFADKPMPRSGQSDAQQEAYEIAPIQGKGQGVVARRRIRRGEIIMVDLPAVLVSMSFLADTKPHHRRRILKQAMKQLPEETRSRVYGLYRGPSQYEVDAILGPNSNTVMLAENEVHVGLFTEVAVRLTRTGYHVMLLTRPQRINHSCRPK